MSEVLAEHLNIIHAARREFIKSESEERIRRALRSKIRVSEQVFVPGDKVFYKRDDQKKWLGPGTVLGQDGKIIFIRHGGFLIRASANRVLNAGNIQFHQERQGNLLESSEPIKSSPVKERSQISSECVDLGLGGTELPEAGSETELETESSSETEPGDTGSSDEVDNPQLPNEDEQNVNIPPNKVPRALARLQDFNQPGLEEAVSAASGDVDHAYVVAVFRSL